MKVAEPIDVEFSTRDSADEPVRGAAVSSLSISASRIDRTKIGDAGPSSGRPASRHSRRLASPCWKNRSCGSAHHGMESWVYSAVQHVEMVSHDFPTNWPM